MSKKSVVPVVPNPGSDEAIKLGCICPVMDNHHGYGIPSDAGPLFWYTSGCPVHTPKVQNDTPIS